MATVYRVENENKLGPYTCDITWLCNKHNGEARHPSPYFDKGLERRPAVNELCAFKNLQQALNWFTVSDLRKLKKEHFELKAINARIVAEGEFQCLVIREGEE
jgi:hypothetical protein